MNTQQSNQSSLSYSNLSQNPNQPQNQSYPPQSPVSVQQTLYQKYSSSQSYFYSKTISQIIKEKPTRVNMIYDDIECLCEEQENLKRFYGEFQHDRKMLAFKQYYFYHQDCPRIFSEKIDTIYEKWHERKRDLVYKKLKIMYGQSIDSSENSISHDQDQHVITHFLLNISQFNPYSKKYYLRVQARKQKQKENNQEQQVKKSKNDISVLNHELSVMLGEMANISMISINPQDDLMNEYSLKTNIKKSKSRPSLEPQKSNLKINFKKKNLQPVTLSINPKSHKNIQPFQNQSKNIIELKTSLNPVKPTHKNKGSSLLPIPEEKKRKSINMNIPEERPLPLPIIEYNSSPKMRENTGLTNPTYSMNSLYGTSKILTTNANSNKMYPSFSVKLKNDDSRVPKLNFKSGSTQIQSKLSRGGNHQSQKKIVRYDSKQGQTNRMAYKTEKKTNSTKKIPSNRGQLRHEQFSDKKLTGTQSVKFRRSYRSQNSESLNKLRINMKTNQTKEGQRNPILKVSKY